MLSEVNRHNPDGHIVLTPQVRGVWCLQWVTMVSIPIVGNHGEIKSKELILVVIAIAIWGINWSGKTLQVHCNNAAVVSDILY